MLHAATEVTHEIDISRPSLNGIRVGTQVDDATNQVVEKLGIPGLNALALQPLGRCFPVNCYVIGWLDNSLLTHQVDGPEGSIPHPIVFIYDDSGKAIGSLPFPDKLPDSFPLPANLEPLRSQANVDLSKPAP